MDRNKIAAAKRVIHLGYVGVDTGQLVIADPCYIDSEWRPEDFKDIRRFKHKVTGDVLEYRKDFENFMSPILKYGNMNMNDLNATGEWEQVPPPPAEHNFSYNACCLKTLSPEGLKNEGGQLNFNLGHPGVGVVFRTGLGDGVYEVYAEVTNLGKWGERITKVEVVMLSDEEIEEILKEEEE